MKPSPETLIAANKKAFHDYEVIEKFEAGIVLLGSEVKALRCGTIHFPGSYVVSRMPRRAASRKPQAARSPKSESGRAANQRAKLPVPILQLINVHIGPYGPAGPGQHIPLRPRTLLLKRREAERLAGAMQIKGQTAVPLDLHFRNGLAKATIALVRGKQLHDKRRTMKEREVKRTLEQAMKRR